MCNQLIYIHLDVLFMQISLDTDMHVFKHKKCIIYYEIKKQERERERERKGKEKERERESLNESALYLLNPL